MPKPSKDAIARLRVVQEQILQSPEFYDQNDYAHFNGCNTVCCIAGWLHYNHVGRKRHNALVKALWAFFYPIHNCAENLLGVKDPNLFKAANYWPKPFASDYANAKTSLARARVAVRRIDHFIATGK